MQQYDIAVKVLIESCKDEIIRYFTGINVVESSMVQQLPQETVSLKRSDFPVMITDSEDKSYLVILEVQTYWSRTTPLNCLDYRIRYLIKHDIEVISCVILLKKSGAATDCYEDNEVTYRYHLVKIFDMDARKIVENGPICLLPFVPIMKNGKELMPEADGLIYNSEIPRGEKANMLTSMAILSGLVSDDLPAKFITRRKDIMIESAAYDIIKKEGYQEGIQEGVQKGIKEGLLLGRETVIDILSHRFNEVFPSIIKDLSKIEDISMLKVLKKKAWKADSIDDFKDVLELMLN